MANKTWTAELRKIERQFDGLPPEPSPLQRASRRINERLTLERKDRRLTALGTLGRTTLVILLAGAINFWPYQHACGAGLVSYLGAESLVVIGGLWTAVFTWQVRAALAHSIAMVMVLWGLVLVGLQVLPRVGYSKTDPLHQPTWSCAAPLSVK